MPSRHVISAQRAAQLTLREFAALCRSLDTQYGEKVKSSLSFSGEILESEHSRTVKFDVLRIERTPEKLIAVVLIDRVGEIVFDMSEVRSDQRKASA
jgi:hypothetical protein